MQIPAQNRFSKCSTCVLLKNKLMDGKVTKQDRERLRFVREEHNREHKQERALRDVRKHKAHHNPSKSMYISIDGMDSSKCALPIMNPYPKDATEGHTFCEPHLIGVITSRKPAHFVFLSSEQFSSDSNLTISCLWNVLLSVGQPLPPKLYIYVSSNLHVFPYELISFPHSLPPSTTLPSPLNSNFTHC